MSSRAPKRIFIPLKQFANHSVKSFSAKVSGKVFHGFVIKKENQFFAYQNLCQHLSIPLDVGKTGDLLSYDRRSIQCATHGALYEIETGLCTAGPCEGANLVIVKVEKFEDQLVLTLPESFESNG